MDYSGLIKSTDFSTYKKNIYTKIQDYQNALDGNKTNVFKSKVTPPLGMKYFVNTGIKCRNNLDRYLYIDAKQSVDKSILMSASSDIDRVTNDLNQSTKNDCKKIKMPTIDKNGKQKYKIHYVGKEPFISPNLQMMNAGQQLFIGSFTILGLFLFYKALVRK